MTGACETLLTAGLDEAGRGCLAGPVVAAAVILPANFELPGLDDSKRLSAEARTRLFYAIRKQATALGLAYIWPRRIEETNILAATLEAMILAARRLQILPQLLLIDGNQQIRPALLQTFWPKSAPLPEQKTIIKGDRLVASISAASIVAKTCRDRLMTTLAKKWPGYGFEVHKGYGTSRHLEALRKFGPCPLHRRTFRGVKNINPAQPGLFD